MPGKAYRAPSTPSMGPGTIALLAIPGVPRSRCVQVCVKPHGVTHALRQSVPTFALLWQVVLALLLRVLQATLEAGTCNQRVNACL